MTFGHSVPEEAHPKAGSSFGFPMAGTVLSGPFGEPNHRLKIGACTEARQHIELWQAKTNAWSGLFAAGLWHVS